VSKVKGTRLSDELALWVEEYAAARGTDAATVLRMAVESFRREAESGVPDLPVADSPQVRRERAQVAAGGHVAPASVLRDVG
jgi:hypothetical protein